MYARVVSGQYQPGKMDEGIQLFRDFLTPAAKEQGSKGLLGLVDRATGKAISITLWETEADLQASETSGYYQEQLAKFAPLFTGPPQREVYEVAAQD
jgi:quinol monooxygenase YgiN